MFSALKKLTRSSDDRCQPPLPMSTSLQKKFSRGVHFNMKILIKGDRNVGKSCLLQRLQGGTFKEEYVPTEQIQVAPIHWTYKNTDFIVKVEVWEVVDKGRIKKKPPLGLKLENQAAPSTTEDGIETPVLDATFLDVYKNANGVILMLDITKPWTFDYVVKELSSIPADLPVIILGNHCDMQHHRQVHAHHIDQALYNAKGVRSAPIRYAESSMRNGFGLRFLHKFLSVPFLRLQKTSLLEQLQRNQKDIEAIEIELTDFQRSDDSHYDTFVDKLANKRRQCTETEPRVNNERSPSIVLGAGKPIVPPSVNPLLAQSLNAPYAKPQPIFVEEQQIKQTHFVSQELILPKSNPIVSMDMTPSKVLQDSSPSTPVTNISVSNSSGALDEFYAGILDSSFLEDLPPMSNVNQEVSYESESDDGNTANPRVTVDQDDIDFDSPSLKNKDIGINECNLRNDDERLGNMFARQTVISEKPNDNVTVSDVDRDVCNNEYPLWARDSSARRSPEGGEDPDVNKEAVSQKDKKHKKKKSKDKEDGDKSEKKEKKHRRKKSKSDKPAYNPQQDLLQTNYGDNFSYDDYDSI